MHSDRYLAQQDAAVLSRLAENLLRGCDVKHNAAQQLIALLTNSILVPENDPRRDFVSLYSSVTWREVGEKDLHRLCIVCPPDANELVACASVLAPLPLALLGRRVGSVVELALDGQRPKRIEIVRVEHAGGAPEASRVQTGLPTLAWRAQANPDERRHAWMKARL